MSKKDEINETPEIVQVDTESPVTVNDLLKLFLQQSKETAASNKVLAEALLQSRIPYVDPSVVANRERARKDREMLVKAEINKRISAKQMCSHRNEGGKLNIKWHQHSNGIILGVCGNCKSEFDATHNPDDGRLLREDVKSIRNMARAGVHANRGAQIAV